MGGFQAVASGLAEGGEQLGQGVNQALSEALKYRAQAAQESEAQARLRLAGQQQEIGQQQFKQSQQQAFTLAQQQHDIYRQQITEMGYKDMGLTQEGGKYFRTFTNPTTGDTRRIEVQGTPPDSFEGQMGRYQALLAETKPNGDRMFSDTQAKQIAFKMTKDYQGGADQMRGFLDLAHDEYGLEGAAAQKKAEQLYGETVGRGGYFRYAMGGGLGNPKDLTGLTPGEMRDYNAAVTPLKQQYNALSSLMRVQMANALTPDQQNAITQQYLPTMMQLQAQEQSLLADIRNKRHPGAGNTLPDITGLMKQLGIPTPQAKGGAWTPPPNAPSPSGQPDGTVLKDQQGNVVAKAKGGKWQNPNTQ